MNARASHDSTFSDFPLELLQMPIKLIHHPDNVLVIINGRQLPHDVDNDMPVDSSSTIIFLFRL
jgi:hypothetical protein